MAEAPETVIRELRLMGRRRPDYFPSKARFEAGFAIAEPVEFELFVPEDRVQWDAMTEHLSAVDHTVFGRYEMTIHAYRTDRRRQGLRVVFPNAYEAVHFKIAFF